ncbi:MAG: gamma-glutamylcyclotransferase family protein [Pseudomonadota bacterium]
MTVSRWFFGYGSLVNDHTLPEGTEWQTVTVRGWRRCWGHTIPRDPAWFALSLVSDPDGAVDGVLIRETATLAPVLVERESGYSPHPLTLDTLSAALPDGDTPWVWLSDHLAEPDASGCLLQSYVDCVMAGFLRHFGADGLDRFIATTDGWTHPVIADRGAPRYPRAVTLQDDATHAIDQRVATAQRRARATGEPSRA